MGCKIDHKDSHKFIITERLCQRYDYSHKGNRFFTHPENSTKKAEKKHHGYNDDVTYASLAHKRETFKFASLAYELQNALINSFCTINDPESSTYDKHKGNDACLLAESLVQGREYLPGLWLTSRHEPGRNGTQNKNEEYDYIGIRNFEFHRLMDIMFVAG